VPPLHVPESTKHTAGGVSHSSGSPAQMPDVQTSPVVQGSPSSHEVPSAAAAYEQTPLLHAPIGSEHAEGGFVQETPAHGLVVPELVVPELLVPEVDPPVASMLSTASPVRPQPSPNAIARKSRRTIRMVVHPPARRNAVVVEPPTGANGATRHARHGDAARLAAADPAHEGQAEARQEHEEEVERLHGRGTGSASAVAWWGAPP
jgi:hypothetical protein